MSSPTSPSLSEQLAAWAVGVRFDDLPAEVVEHTRLRILDVVGLALAGHDTPFGASVRAAVTRASAVRSSTLGTISAASTPMMTSTTISSIRVKPRDACVVRRRRALRKRKRVEVFTSASLGRVGSRES